MDQATADPRRALTRVRFRRAIALMVMTLLLPGSAQLVAGRKQVGRIAMRIWLGLVAAVVLLLLIGLSAHSFVYWFFTQTFFLDLIRFGLMGVAIGWAYLFMDSWMIGDPLRLQRQQRLAMVGINGVLCFSVSGTLLFASHLVSVQRDFLVTMFGGTKVTQVHNGRYNVLLLGGDSGSDRWGLRPDSINVASIDAKTGKTVLFGLPRNMLNFPFAPGSKMAKLFPHGYKCDDKCFNDPNELGLHELNSLVTYTVNHKSQFKGIPQPGIAATEQAVEGITGLKINYYGMINLMGFRKLVQAVGGVKLHVRQPIPIGGIGSPVTGHIQPGYRKLNGFQTLWFARSRVAADDYSRMARQKCVMVAMLHQASPQTVVENFSKIAQASESMFDTDLPQSQVSTFAQLALKARNQPVKTVSFVPPTVSDVHPDIAKIHRMVQQAINPPKAKKHHQAAQQSKPATVDGGSLGDMQHGYAANDSSNLAADC